MAAEQDQDRALDRLNPTERDLLALLGRGHTAKSIATLRSLSVAAVNERFRSARRKTGVGSSREIARLIVAQENRHDFIDLGGAPSSPSDPPRPDTLRRVSPLRRWRLPMAAAFLLAAAIFAQQTSVPHAPQRSEIPPGAEAMFASRDPSPDLAALHAEVAAGPADPAWSAASESGLSRAYRDAIDPSAALASLEVTCNASLCEVIGVGRGGLSAIGTSALMDAVQSRAVHETATALGVESVVQAFDTSLDETAPGAPSAIVFAAYWRRTTASD